MKEDTKKYLRELFQGSYRASTIGLVLVISILIGGLLGYWLYTVFNSVIFFILGLIVGIVAGFRQVYLLGQKYK
ncbi:MAG: AtpZ/AtpI family protein [Desulfobaccales bacterium]